jgi:nickel-type superoxide dismutase maturation protease
MQFPIKRFRVEDYSMAPTFLPNDYVLVSTFSYIFRLPRANEVIIIKLPHNGPFIIKRIERVLSANKYFVIGDNKNNSIDSRKFGPIDLKNIVGRVILKIR